MRVRKIATKKEIHQAFAIRLRVFVKEQGVPREIELDEDDRKATHLLACEGDKSVGTARIVFHSGSAKIGRMAVLKRYRGRGIGMQLLKRAVAVAKRRGSRTIYLHAQTPVVGFYEKIGFKCHGPAFSEADIPHRKMILADDR